MSADKQNESAEIITQAELANCIRLHVRSNELAGAFAARIKDGARVERGPIRIEAHPSFGEPHDSESLEGFTANGANLGWPQGHVSGTE